MVRIPSVVAVLRCNRSNISTSNSNRTKCTREAVGVEAACLVTLSSHSSRCNSQQLVQGVYLAAVVVEVVEEGLAVDSPLDHSNNSTSIIILTTSSSRGHRQ